MQKKYRRLNLYDLLRLFIYIIEFFVLYSIQQIPGFIPELFGGKPVILIPLFFTISILEGNYFSVAWGLISGLVLDISLGSYIGVQIVTMGILGYVIGKIKERFFEANIFTFLVINLLFTPLIIILRFYISYILRGFNCVDIAFYKHIIPCIIYTFAISSIVYLFNKPIWFFIRKKEGV